MIAIGFADPGKFVLGIVVGVVLVLLIALLHQMAVFRRLNALSLPDDYVAKYRLQSTLAKIGYFAAISMFTYGVVGWMA